MQPSPSSLFGSYCSLTAAAIKGRTKILLHGVHVVDGHRESERGEPQGTCAIRERRAAWHREQGEESLRAFF